MIPLLNPYATLWTWIRETPLHPTGDEDGDAWAWTLTPDDPASWTAAL